VAGGKIPRDVLTRALSRWRTRERTQEDHDDGECGEHDDDESATSVEAEEEGMRGRHLTSRTRQTIASKDDKEGDHD
jgi:hypothetical protein